MGLRILSLFIFCKNPTKKEEPYKIYQTKTILDIFKWQHQVNNGFIHIKFKLYFFIFNNL
jgi:hypothetical protein